MAFYKFWGFHYCDKWKKRGNVFEKEKPFADIPRAKGKGHPHHKTDWKCSLIIGDSVSKPGELPKNTVQQVRWTDIAPERENPCRECPVEVSRKETYPDQSDTKVQTRRPGPERRGRVPARPIEFSARPGTPQEQKSARAALRGDYYYQNSRWFTLPIFQWDVA